ncbi:MAG: UDP-N-acetylglucosamine--N-acetylmuramyl-(pentapeptide) pyrophosphoryl-undecaprenol N-acetylglucosamine transferase [Candidatus Pacebacteria bacterium]|nr:UDP-N-acetylglucosamine--N-acetylmuramyl-(pentapeptide) pyrophosphoryl-undecaprenol N-acetylglucosamine transferase [Candidatus Paceibacterota bacterium]
MSGKKVVITGGHHNCALVVAEKLRRRGWQVFWFGHKFTMLKDQRLSAEYQEVKKAGFDFYEIKAGKISRNDRLSYLFRLPQGFVQSADRLLKIKPDLIISFGGYLAVPVVVTGWFLRIPSITHEQTAVYGWANCLIGRLAQKILVSWSSSLKHFPAKKVVFTGLPLRKEIFLKGRKISFNNKKPTIYITGGKQGSHLLNQAVGSSLKALLLSYNLIHQCGSNSIFNDRLWLERLARHLPSGLRKNYLVRDYFYRDQIGPVFASADLIVSRAGAHTVYEIAALGKPALLIPIPWSHAREQQKNAQRLEKIGLAEILPQDRLSPKSLIEALAGMAADLDFYRQNAPKALNLISLDAAEKIVDLVEKL